MKRSGKKSILSKKNLPKIALVFFTAGAFLISTAYALSTQLFTISGSATIVNYGECPSDVSFIYDIPSSWGDSNNGYTYHVRLTVKNNSNTGIDTWSITFKGPSDLSFNYVGAEATVDRGEATLTPTGNYSWAANIAAGSSRDIDFQVNTAEPTLSLEYLYFGSCMVITGGNSSPLMDFSVEPEQMSLRINQSSTISIHKMPIDARADFDFVSTNTAVAAVNSNGVVTGLSPGTASVKVSSGSKVRTISVTVVDEHIVLTSLSISPKENTMKVGDEKTLTTEKLPADAGDVVTYTSSDPSVATVDSNGKVVAVADGTAVITASAGNFTDTANISVIRDAIGEDIEASFSHAYYDNSNIQFAINLANIGRSEVHKITFKISFPPGTTWTYWNNYPAMFTADSSGTVVTSTNPQLLLTGGSYINFTGNVTLPSGYNSSDYLSPTIYDIEVE